jgi:hypothetical protein
MTTEQQIIAAWPCWASVAFVLWVISAAIGNLIAERIRGRK